MHIRSVLSRSVFLDRYAPPNVAHVWMHFDAGSRQAHILLLGGFEEIHRQHYIFLKDSIFLLTEEDHYPSL